MAVSLERVWERPGQELEPGCGGRDWSAEHLAGALARRRILALHEHAMQSVLAFASAEDLLRWETTCRAAGRTTPRAWQGLVRARWAVPVARFRAKAFGGSTWKQAYVAMAGRQRLPRGRMTHRHNLVFGHGAADGVETWLTLHHREDCRLRRHIAGFGPAPDSDSPQRYIEFRLVIQNLRHATVDLQAGAATLELLGEGGRVYQVAQVGAGPELSKVPETTEGGACERSGGAAYDFPQLLAYNGRTRADLTEGGGPKDRAAARRFADNIQSVPDLPTVDLLGGDRAVAARRLRLVNPMHFAVVSLVFPMPATFVFETDVLVRACRLTVPATVTDAYTGERREIESVSTFKREEFIWKHYEYLPGGFLVLQVGGHGAEH